MFKKATWLLYLFHKSLKSLWVCCVLLLLSQSLFGVGGGWKMGMGKDINHIRFSYDAHHPATPALQLRMGMGL